jgi:MYXO-CTERM domain-containing protein
MKTNLCLAAGLIAGAASLAFAGQATACGGLFCNRPQAPTDLPVAQTGENVLFSMDPMPSGLNRLEAHIQIFYKGPADRFSWVLPVDALPTLDVGSNAVFTALDLPTRPKLMVTRRREGVCSDESAGVSFGSGGSSTKRGGGGGDAGAGGVQVSFRGNVGPFDAVVVRADEPNRLKAWLAENMYYLSDEGSQLLDTYVLEQKYFVALKLLPGKGIEEIQPIVLRMEARAPCVPLRLTAVAAFNDLRVNLWVLAQHRVVPENFFEITINEAKFDWLGGGNNYQELLTTAANEAGGNAFAVEYAGPSNVVGALVPPNVNLSDLDTFQISRSYAENTLRSMGLVDAEVTQVLNQYFSQPLSMTLAAMLEARVLKPRRALQAMVASHPKLTRLVTFISPDEMKIDPTFIENSTLPDVSNVRTAVAVLQCGAREYSSCNAPIRVELPSGQQLFYAAPASGGWCSSQLPDDRRAFDQMPSLERGWSRGASGEGLLRFDNRAAIGSALSAQKEAVLGGCSCAIGARGTSAPLAWLVALALLLTRRRWRR